MERYDVTPIVERILSRAKDKISEIPSDKRKSLFIISVGNDPASAAYMRGKVADCKMCDIPVCVEHIDDNAEAPYKLHRAIMDANEDDSVGGIILQLPLPEWIKEKFTEEFFTNQINPLKDVDGFESDSPFSPCTPEGIIEVMREELWRLRSLDVLLVGKGKLVGKPLIGMLLDEGCTPTICHSRTKGIKEKLAQYHDTVIFATGEGNLFDLHDVNAGLVIDATIVKGKDGKLHGDCYGFDPEYSNGMKVTPVPGGVGLMTRAMLIKHMMLVNKP